MTTPPGELMYMKMSFFGFSDSRKSSWAVISEAIWSSTPPGDEDDPLAQQPRIDVEAALAAVRLLDDDRNEAADDVLMVGVPCGSLSLVCTYIGAIGEFKRSTQKGDRFADRPVLRD